MIINLNQIMMIMQPRVQESSYNKTNFQQIKQPKYNNLILL